MGSHFTLKISFLFQIRMPFKHLLRAFLQTFHQLQHDPVEEENNICSNAEPIGWIDVTDVPPCRSLGDTPGSTATASAICPMDDRPVSR